jgi:hypothetical protein
MISNKLQFFFTFLIFCCILLYVWKRNSNFARFLLHIFLHKIYREHENKTFYKSANCYFGINNY